MPLVDLDADEQPPCPQRRDTGRARAQCTDSSTTAPSRTLAYAMANVMTIDRLLRHVMPTLMGAVADQALMQVVDDVARAAPVAQANSTSTN
jgi:hypothetical protein